jgi:hypothetical protein
MGVLTAAVDRGPWQVEGSLFHGSEPDEQRWDLMDPGPLDSWSVRGWHGPTRPGASRCRPVSLGARGLEPGDIQRTTASGSWMRRRDGGWTAATVAYGRNNKVGSDFNAFLQRPLTRSVPTLPMDVLKHECRERSLRFGIHTFIG